MYHQQIRSGYICILEINKWVNKHLHKLFILLPLQTPFRNLKYPLSQVSHLPPTYPGLHIHFPVLLQVVFALVPIGKHLHSRIKTNKLTILKT